MNDPYITGVMAALELGQKLERERIIRLLLESKLLITVESGALTNYAEIAIALIKGENK